MVHFITCMMSMVDMTSAHQVPFWCSEKLLHPSTLLFTAAVASGLLYHRSYRCTCLNHKLELCVQDSVHQFICRYIECVTSCIREKIASRVAVRGDSGVAYEGKVVGVSKFDFWGKCTIPMLPLAFVLCWFILFILRGSFILHLGV